MKKHLIIRLSLLMCATVPVFAQAQTQGVINYTIVMQLRKSIAKQNPTMAAMIPETTSREVEVVFKNENFLVTMRPSSSSSETSQGNMRMMLTNSGDAFLNLKTNTLKSAAEFDNKKYYSESKFESKNNIEYTNEAPKQIAGFSCRKAIVTDYKGTKTTVWYTTSLPYAYSPEGVKFANLKGAVMKFENELESGTATAVVKREVNASELSPNLSAKKISSDQMKDLQDEDREKRKAKLQGGSHVKDFKEIKINN